MDELPPIWATARLTGDDYDAVMEARAARKGDPHGEAAFVEQLHPRTLLDAGCGTGRVARELARRGIAVVGVDIDTDMLATAHKKAPEVDWRAGDLATISLGMQFEIILLAGNVMIFLQPGSEEAVVTNMARHLQPSGKLVAGFQLDFGLSLERFDALAKAAGLRLIERWATWDRDPWISGGRYAVSVHQQPDEASQA